MEKKLVLIDGNAVLHRAFHAIPPLTTRIGEPINAVYGFVSILLNVIQNLTPTHFVVAFDEKEKTFRHKLLPDYQAQRPPTDEALLSQFEKARQFLISAKIPVYSKAGYEADDVIGTIAKEAIEKDKVDSVVIVTGDRDILQLVSDKVKLFMPTGGLSSGKVYGVDETIERMGVTPSRIIDLKGLTGDASDNYKGVPGIGPKTALQLLGEFDSFKGIYENLEKVKESTRLKLVNGRKSGETSYLLAGIVTDVPIKVNYDEMTSWDVDSLKVLDLFSEFGFRTLTARIKSVGKDLEKKNQGSLF